jgi:hypothetical protein
MSQRRIVNRVGLVAAATAISAMVVPAPALAEPRFPLAPACEKWTYPTQSILLTQDNGIVVALYLRGIRFEGPASHTVAGKPDVTGGYAVGSLDGNHIEFHVDWQNGASNNYNGAIADDGTARGSTVNHRGHQNSWQSQLKFSCATPPAQDFPPVVTGLPKGPVTADAPPPPPPPPPPPNLATVTGDVDVYDKPNFPPGSAKLLGILRGGKQVQVVGNCNPDDWCVVKGPDVPTGQGTIWGHLQLP